MRSTIGRKVTTSLNRPRSRPFSSCIGKRLAEGNPVLSGVHRRFYRRPIDASSPLFSRDRLRHLFSRSFHAAKNLLRHRASARALEKYKSKRKNIGGREGRATLWSGPETIGDESSNGIEGGPTIHFSSKRGAREGEGKFLFNSIKLFLCRALRCSNGPVYLLAYRDGRKESIKSKLGRDGGGFARDFVTSGRCFIDLNPLTGGTLRGYSPIVFTARDALEISSRPLPPRGEGSTYLRGFMSLPLVVKVS